MDGELGEQDVQNVMEALRNDDLRVEWKTYHLIGDTLRKSARLSTDVSYSVSQKLITEPIVLFPEISNISKIPKQQKHKVFAYSMAASVIAIISGWIIMHNSSYVPQQAVVAENPNQNNVSVVPVMVTSPALLNNHPLAEINEYLIVHREFSPGTNMRGQITNVNSVNQYNESYGR
jgi:sigma-E factor negative regulatory protein RseA